MANRFDLVNLSNILQTSANGTVANVNFDSNTLFIDGVNNRVGIGTSSPITQLAVVGGAMQFSPGTSAQEGVRIQRADGVCTFSGINNDNNAFNGLAFFTSASEAMRIDTSGRITTPAQPAFYAFRNDGSYSPGNSFVIPWNNTAYNIGGHYNTSNGRFTAPVAGLYYFHYHQYFRGNYTGRHAIYRNNSSVGLMQVGRGNTGGEWTHSLSLAINCAANDFVDCRTDFTGELFMAADHSWFMGFLIG